MNEKIATSLRPVPATAGCSLQKSTGLFAHRSRPRNDKVRTHRNDSGNDSRNDRVSLLESNLFNRLVWRWLLG